MSNVRRPLRAVLPLLTGVLLLGSSSIHAGPGSLPKDPGGFGAASGSLAAPSGAAGLGNAVSAGLAEGGRALEAALHRAAPSLRLQALRDALASWRAMDACGELGRPRLTVIDYSLPSTVRRLWVFDVATRRLLFHELVAHGKNSGEDRTVAFSNEIGSLMSSLGTFVTGTTYTGKNGYSLYLRGMDPGVNDRAEERTIVIHGAPYVGKATARQLHRLGRSWGCPALRPEIARALIDEIKDR
jgi:hypothetical protein